MVSRAKIKKTPGVAFFGPEVANIIGNIQPDGSPETNAVMQAYQVVHGYVAAQVQARNAGEWYDDESDDDDGDEDDEDDEDQQRGNDIDRGEGMVDIRQLTALLPTQVNTPEGSAASSGQQRELSSHKPNLTC